MNYLSVENVSKAFGERVLFENLSFGINKDQKIAFIAKNGTGKTTLLDIIAGIEHADTGQVINRKGLKIAYLSQQDQLQDHWTIEQSILETDNPILKIVSDYEKALENPDNHEAYQAAFDQMDQHQAWDFETQYKQILSRLKLNDLNASVSDLSGGQRKRLSLAICLLKRPDLLILDEPTNHLDLEMIEWLEQFFAKESITLFMVTHDRYFLERVCNEIIELDQGVLHKYKGNYSYYLAKKEERLMIEQVTQEKAKNLFKKELDWMRRQPKARTTKSKSRIDDFKVIKKAAHNRRKEHVIQLAINPERLGSKIVEFHKVSKAFEEKKILNGFDYVFKKGERIGIIGKNGSGKSTFLNILTKGILPDAGKVVVGETVKFGYYTQSGIKIKPGQKVIEVIREFGEYIPLEKGNKISAAQLLERFLFDRKKQHDFVEKLSGGEQKRLYLCAVLIQNPNFLILDEPTNDLDVVTLNVLESFLLDFPGNLMVVSHDRYFMDKIVDSLFVFEGEGTIMNFPGNYTDYRVYESSQIKESKNPASSKPTPVQKSSKPVLSYKEKKEFNGLEKEIEKLEKKKTTLEESFALGVFEGEQVNEAAKELQSLIDEIESKEMRWLELSEKSVS
ncbi:ABC-F family ATP-binding cassette domain-containing protein [Flavobacteriaceae bacterium]|nr:ABC-F family ATP-binding cassette domain-containing protein [Flavobacteriaceae bacterium]